MTHPAIAEPRLIRFEKRAPRFAAGSRTWFIRSRSFLLAWAEVQAGAAIGWKAEREHLLLLPDGGAMVESGEGGARASGHSVVVTPAGETRVTAEQAGRVIALFAPAPEAFRDVPIEGGDAGAPLQELDPPFQRLGAAGPVIHRLDEIPNSPGMSRAKLFQSATMSINWVEYEGPRDRANLSPHGHTDFEQGSLAIAGTFVHHFRTPWMRDANLWREDLHLECGPASLAIIPPSITHTTEGVGPGRHVLIDIFAPPRRDFIAKGQILNAADYRDARQRER
jgi:hypothetical protein